MDYDDLVDQFIVNDGNTETNENDQLKSEGNCSEKSETSELMKIHLNTLIRSRQIARRTAQLDRVKERNRSFEAQKKEILSLSQGSGPINIQNSEKRRKILSKSSPEGAESSEISPSTNSSNELIPCRLELDYDGYKLSDVFLISPADAHSDVLNLL